MFDSYLLRQCAPTLAGLKVGNLFCLDIADGVLVCNVLVRWNRTLNPKGVFACVVAEKRGRYYVYVYRKSELANLGKSAELCAFLKRFGYVEFGVDSLLCRFKRRMAMSECFPHEVGVFLGYPLADVRDFIAYGGRNYKHIGYWKVYNDVPNSIRIGEVYRKCKNDLWNRFERGAPLEKLTVAC